MFHRISRNLIAATIVPLAFGRHINCQEEARRKKENEERKIANLSKYKNLILLPGSANMKLAEDVASHLGVELGKIETARFVYIYAYYVRFKILIPCFNVLTDMLMVKYAVNYTIQFVGSMYLSSRAVPRL